MNQIGVTWEPLWAFAVFDLRIEGKFNGTTKMDIDRGSWFYKCSYTNIKDVKYFRLILKANLNNRHTDRPAIKMKNLIRIHFCLNSLFITDIDLNWYSFDPSWKEPSKWIEKVDLKVWPRI